MIITLFVRLRSLTFSVITHNSLPLAVAKMLPENKYNKTLEKYLDIITMYRVEHFLSFRLPVRLYES